MSASFRDFLASFGERWFVAMSGPIGVPLAVYSILGPAGTLSVLLGFTGLAAIVFSSFRVWKTQRDQVIDLQKQMTPRLEMSFENKAPWIIEKWQTPDPATNSLFVHVRVWCTRRVTGCVANVTRLFIEENGEWRQAEAFAFREIDWDLYGRGGIYIDPGVDRFLQMFHIPQSTGVVELLSFTNYKHQIVFERGRRYRIDFTLGCNEQVHPLNGSLVFKLGPEWNQVQGQLLLHPQEPQFPQGSKHGLHYA